ncbi:hypothetical protein CROQUDRAFT_660257 [Cronartium quercuum f. sp. fusiforme G11]|uniref:Uncharacterized protein n=1 Tax=Cronartium quercuum f. sp. fusiforme G11 TaxID=708437 RepID=A0A9P6NCJ0_9BASI|nr:hypothetical protein CROQUDRAFT_660257 [Cronartium quercuum f. sp. fusiforme G11]
MNTLLHPTQLDSTQPSKTIQMPSKKTSNKKDRRTDLSRSMGLIQLSHPNRLNWACSRSGGQFDERWDCREILLRVVVDVRTD